MPYIYMLLTICLEWSCHKLSELSRVSGYLWSIHACPISFNSMQAQGKRHLISNEVLGMCLTLFLKQKIEVIASLGLYYA